MNLSMMSYTMARRPDLFDLEKMFDLTLELDLAGVDLVTLHDRTAPELRAMADDCGVPVVCHTFQASGRGAGDPALTEQAVDEAKRGIEAAVVLGAPVVMIVPVPGKETDRGTSRRQWIAGLRQVMTFADAAGVTVTVENFPGDDSPFVTADDFLEAAREVPGLKLTFDNGNAASGEPPADSFERTAAYVVHAHFKDWTIRDTEAEGHRRMLDGRWYKPALIGEGDVDHASCLRAMRDAGYQGCINVEYEGNDYIPEEGVCRAVAYLRGLGV